VQGLAHDGVDQPPHRGVVDVADLVEVLLAVLGGLQASTSARAPKVSSTPPDAAPP
jgi:hypothetical protein